MDTYANMSYDIFLQIIIRKGFIPMYGCNLRNPFTEKMSSEYHISANLDRGLFLTSESHNNILHESKLYYELNVSRSGQDRATVDSILDLLKNVKYTRCDCLNDKSILAVVYNAENELVSHLDILNKKDIYTNNPWLHLNKHDLKIIDFNDDRIKSPGYRQGNEWLFQLPKEARYMIGLKQSASI